MPRNRSTNLAPDDVVEPRMCAPFVAETYEEFRGVDDPPAGKRVHLHIGLVLGGHLDERPIPLENAAVQLVDHLHKRQLEIEPRAHFRLAHRTSKASDDRRLRLTHGVATCQRCQQHGTQNKNNQKSAWFHFATPVPVP